MFQCFHSMRYDSRFIGPRSFFPDECIICLVVAPKYEWVVGILTQCQQQQQEKRERWRNQSQSTSYGHSGDKCVLSCFRWFFFSFFHSNACLCAFYLLNCSRLDRFFFAFAAVIVDTLFFALLPVRPWMNVKYIRISNGLSHKKGMLSTISTFFDDSLPSIFVCLYQILAYLLFAWFICACYRSNILSVYCLPIEWILSQYHAI